MYYLDTNIFLYSSYPNPFKPNCQQILKKVGIGLLKAATSLETVQEIIFVTWRTGQLGKGLKLSNKIFSLDVKWLDVNQPTIEKYLVLMHKYPKADSRDALHVASALNNNIKEIVSYDKGFDKFREIKRLDPSEFVKQLKN